MLEGTIKLQGEAGCGKQLMLQEIEELLRNPKYAALKIVCRIQLPGQPEEVTVTFKKAGQGQKLSSNWTV